MVYFHKLYLSMYNEIEFNVFHHYIFLSRINFLISINTPPFTQIGNVNQTGGIIELNACIYYIVLGIFWIGRET